MSDIDDFEVYYKTMMEMRDPLISDFKKYMSNKVIIYNPPNMILKI